MLQSILDKVEGNEASSRTSWVPKSTESQSPKLTGLNKETRDKLNKRMGEKMLMEELKDQSSFIKDIMKRIQSVRQSHDD